MDQLWARISGNSQDNLITFQNFMEIFDLQIKESHNIVNAFKLLAQDSDTFIPFQEIQGILENQDLTES